MWGGGGKEIPDFVLAPDEFIPDSKFQNTHLKMYEPIRTVGRMGFNQAAGVRAIALALTNSMM